MIHSRIAYALTYPHVEAHACRELWCAVLLCVLRDLCTARPRSSERKGAERWVGDWPDRDFRTVCHLAGVDPDWVHGAMTRLVAVPVPERRQRLAALLDCQPEQIGASLMVRQEAFEGPERRRRKTRRKTGQGADKPDGVPIAAGARRQQVAALFARGVTPSDMPETFAARGHEVSMATIWNDMRVLRKTGLVGYAREPVRAHPSRCPLAPTPHREGPSP